MSYKNWLTFTCANESCILNSWPTSNFKISVTQWPSLQIGKALFAFIRDSYAHMANGTSINSITEVLQRPRPSWKCGKPDSRKTFYRLLILRKPFPASSALYKRIQVVWLNGVLVTHIICMRCVSSKNELLHVITMRFFSAVDIRLWVLPKCVGIRYDLKCKN